ncbi:PTS sugar transporter subunit IIB [Candidatus Enterococcus ferrettii]|uniref:PTS system, D-glucosaminate-specific IIB component n=1 Tax=Candidatus Enterococcus ferrettii TaxID=2815324 RepID=A0ABV0EPE3_9ENTE|nr:PTS sugar transporter subunit IIB [Enterococcus sp. 665A]MBO1340716.1 PTS sugar transporter subunit IIB [Enterococcus sp. 665A]
MDRLKLVRIDFRLIHGQVITKWNKKAQAKQIMIVDDQLSKDPFMADIYVMAAPPGVSVEICTIDDFSKKCMENSFEYGSILVLLKSIDTAKQLFDNGVKLKELQIGGTGSGAGKVNISKGIALTKEEYQDLSDMAASGTKVYIQMIPEDSPVSIEKVGSKF